MYDLWKKAVIHLESAEDDSDAHEAMVNRGDISGMRKNRFHGTALYLRDDDEEFLVTARHVVFDKQQAAERLQRSAEAHHDDPERQEREKIEAERSIAKIIYRVRSYSEFVSGSPEVRGAFLMNLGAGVPEMRSYTFSDAAADLAIISLKRYPIVSQDLRSNGYDAVSVNAITSGPSGEGAEVFSVGYPSSISSISTIGLSEAELMWASNTVSLPAFSFGRVAMLHEGLRTFWADLSVFSGSSGSPVIEGSQLVGIVIANALETADDEYDDINVRVPFASVSKAMNILPIIAEQKLKTRSLDGEPGQYLIQRLAGKVVNGSIG